MSSPALKNVGTAYMEIQRVRVGDLVSTGPPLGLASISRGTLPTRQTLCVPFVSLFPYFLF